MKWIKPEDELPAKDELVFYVLKYGQCWYKALGYINDSTTTSMSGVTDNIKYLVAWCSSRDIEG